MDEKLIDYTRVVALMAQQDVLEAQTAVHFCKAVLPQLLVELEVMRRVAQNANAFLGSIAPQPQEATPEQEPAAKPKQAKPKRRKAKGGRK
jgi:hypothetical protein